MTAERSKRFSIRPKCQTRTLQGRRRSSLKCIILIIIRGVHPLLFMSRARRNDKTPGTIRAGIHQTCTAPKTTHDTSHSHPNQQQRVMRRVSEGVVRQSARAMCCVASGGRRNSSSHISVPEPAHLSAFNHHYMYCRRRFTYVL